MAVRGHTYSVTIQCGPLCSGSGSHLGRAEASHFPSEGEAYQFNETRAPISSDSLLGELADEVEGWGAQREGRGALFPHWGVETAPHFAP